jgi:hypothetical protein
MKECLKSDGQQFIDIAEILLQVALNSINQIKSIPLTESTSACSKVVTEYPMSYGMNC